MRDPKLPPNLRNLKISTKSTNLAFEVLTIYFVRTVSAIVIVIATPLIRYAFGITALKF